MRRRPIKFVCLPVAITATAMLVGIFAPWPKGGMAIPFQFAVRLPIADLTPFTVLFLTYYVWNVYHFARQNYGVLSLYRRRRPITSAFRYGQRFLFSDHGSGLRFNRCRLCHPFAVGRQRR
jgi:hypothetical protein